MNKSPIKKPRRLPFGVLKDEGNHQRVAFRVYNEANSNVRNDGGAKLYNA